MLIDHGGCCGIDDGQTPNTMNGECLDVRQAAIVFDLQVDAAAQCRRWAILGHHSSSRHDLHIKGAGRIHKSESEDVVRIGVGRGDREGIRL